jgi:hypothetical protein
MASKGGVFAILILVLLAGAGLWLGPTRVVDQPPFVASAPLERGGRVAEDPDHEISEDVDDEVLIETASRDEEPKEAAGTDKPKSPNPKPPHLVPSEVVAALESAPGQLDAILAPEAHYLGVDTADALPLGSKLSVVRGSWSEAGGSATLLAEVSAPDGPVELHVVVLARVGSEWLVSGTILVEP